jgi:hypothetical protein
MNIELSYSVYLILISQSLLLGAACIALTRFQSRCRNIEKFWDSPTGAMLADDHRDEKPAKDAIISVKSEQELLEKIALDQRVTDLQRRLDELGKHDRQKQQEISFEIERNLPIENALRMAKNGASVEALTTNCGLNVGEARLLQKLHGPTQRLINQG